MALQRTSFTAPNHTILRDRYTLSTYAHPFSPWLLRQTLMWIMAPTFAVVRQFGPRTCFKRANLTCSRLVSSNISVVVRKALRIPAVKPVLASTRRPSRDVRKIAYSVPLSLCSARNLVRTLFVVVPIVLRHFTHLFVVIFELPSP